jgi:hypothetical protein
MAAEICRLFLICQVPMTNTFDMGLGIGYVSIAHVVTEKGYSMALSDVGSVPRLL